MATLHCHFHVYRCFDADDRLLYVGMTSDKKARFGVHKSRSAWWHLMARMTVSPKLTKVDAVALEAAAIQNEGPIFNKSKPKQISPAEIYRQRLAIFKHRRVYAKELREAGCTWVEIGRALGVTRQRAQQLARPEEAP